MTSRHRAATVGLLLLTAATGAIDAVSFLALDRVFTGNMTGNLLFVAFGIMGVDGVSIANNALALVGFVLGAALGAAFVGRGDSGSFTRRGGVVLGTALTSITVVAAAWTIAGSLSSIAMLVITTLLAALLGAQVSAVKPIGNSDITTVVITSTLANAARESRLGAGGQTRRAWIDRTGAIVAMLAGATAGTALVTISGGPAALILAALVIALATAVLWRATHAREE